MMAWDYASRLYNAEVNVRRNPWRRVTVLAGFRWVNLTEELEGILLPPIAHGTGSFWDTQTKNNLYGFQIGADAKLLERDRFSIDSMLKAGIFDDHAEEATTVRMERIQFGESASTNHLAFVGEIGVQCKYQVTPRLSLKAGYEAIWLQGVALAPGQIAETYCHIPFIPQDIYVRHWASIAAPASFITGPPPAWSIRSRVAMHDSGSGRSAGILPASLRPRRPRSQDHGRLFRICTLRTIAGSDLCLSDRRRPN